MSEFVLDCSITMTWCFRDEVTPETTKVLDELERGSAIVPRHWNLEVLNCLWMAERKGRITSAKAREFIGYLKPLPIRMELRPRPLIEKQLYEVCRAYDLTAYDAAYLELALRKKEPLASLDDRLRAAALKAGVPLLGKV